MIVKLVSGRVGDLVNDKAFAFTKSPIHPLTNCAFMPVGEVAQLVEHTTENRSVDSSILSLATTF